MSPTFGRFSDSFKPKVKVNAWSDSEKFFEEKKYFDSYAAFFTYLNDDSLNNVIYTRENGRIDFHFFQGSKVINGTITENKITAEAPVAEFEKLSVAFMRRLMEMNYSLYYNRFALKDSRIVIKFNSSIPDGSPRKLYYALKELAIRADKQDDILIDDFAMLKPADFNSESITDEEKEIKYKYFNKWLTDTLTRVSSLKEDTFSGGISYILLNLLYKIDYLITPEGTLMNDLEKISFTYFTRDNKPFEEKNRNMKQDLQKLLEKPKEKIIEDLYKVKSTFGIANPANHPQVTDVFNSNLNNVKWYAENKYEDIAVTIYEYITGYCLFTFGLAKPTLKLFNLLYNIIEQDFYIEMGIPEKYYDKENKKFNEQLVKDKINEIIKSGLEQFPELKFNTDNLKFDTMLDFLRTYFTEIQNLKY
ncbi:MAG: hypothetical protein EHM58_10165 [Ignavibacteriae bacterium]|nr:MAG: hypothetical protein EHM58_10165 [Ignavibacteriota bacterium]